MANNFFPAVQYLKEYQPENQLDQFAKMQAIKNSQQTAAQSAQSFPLEQQQRQAAVTAGNLQNQQTQIALKNMQSTQAALSDPNFNKDFEDWQSGKSQPPSAQPAPGQPTTTTNNQPADGSAGAQPSANQATPTLLAPGMSPQTPLRSAAASTVQLHPLAQYLAERKGLPFFGPGGALDISDKLNEASQKMATLSKTQGTAGATALKNHADQLNNFEDLAEPILAEKDPAKQAQGLQNLQSEIGAHPELYPQEANAAPWIT
jgi:hypothetical protein